MSIDAKLNTKDKLTALWSQFAHEISKEGSVAVPFVFDGRTSKVGFLHIAKRDSSAVFELSFSSEKDQSHYAVFTGSGFPSFSITFNSINNKYDEDSVLIGLKLGEEYKTLDIAGSPAAKEVITHVEQMIDKAYQANIV